MGSAHAAAAVAKATGATARAAAAGAAAGATAAAAAATAATAAATAAAAVAAAATACVGREHGQGALHWGRVPRLVGALHRRADASAQAGGGRLALALHAHVQGVPYSLFPWLYFPWLYLPWLYLPWLCLPWLPCLLWPCLIPWPGAHDPRQVGVLAQPAQLLLLQAPLLRRGQVRGGRQP